MNVTEKSAQVCIDANLVIDTLVPGPRTEATVNLLAQWRKNQVQLIAPTLLAFEVTANLRRFVYTDVLSIEQGERVFSDFQRMNIDYSNRRDIIPLAWKLAKEFNRPRAYDTAYLALAQLKGCEFFTADERLYNAVHDTLDWVRWIGQ